MGGNAIFRPFGVAAQGDEDAATLYQAIGRALTHWESVEDTMTGLFGAIVRPNYVQPAVRAAYLAATAPRSRKDMIVAAGAVFFRFFPNKQLADSLKALMKDYENGASRRNEVAHGIVAGHVLQSRPRFTGYYLGPHSISTKKRGDKNDPLYLVSTAELDTFIQDIGSLGAHAGSLSASLRAHWQSSPEKARTRY